MTRLPKWVNEIKRTERVDWGDQEELIKALRIAWKALLTIRQDNLGCGENCSCKKYEDTESEVRIFHDIPELDGITADEAMSKIEKLGGKP